MARLLTNPLTPLISFATVLSVCFVLYLIEEQDTSLLFETITSRTWSLLLIYWIIADTRSRRATSCVDFGFLCVVFFPLSLPWHCFRSRGWRGVLTLLMLLAIFMLPYLVAGMTWTVLYGP